MKYQKIIMENKLHTIRILFIIFYIALTVGVIAGIIAGNYGTIYPSEDPLGFLVPIVFIVFPAAVFATFIVGINNILIINFIKVFGINNLHFIDIASFCIGILCVALLIINVFSWIVLAFVLLPYLVGFIFYLVKKLLKTFSRHEKSI